MDSAIGTEAGVGRIMAQEEKLSGLLRLSTPPNHLLSLPPSHTRTHASAPHGRQQQAAAEGARESPGSERVIAFNLKESATSAESAHWLKK